MHTKQLPTLAPLTMVSSAEIGNGHVQWQRTALGLRGSVFMYRQGLRVTEAAKSDAGSEPIKL